MIPVEKIELIINKYKNLEKELASGNIDKKNFVKKSKEYSRIGEIIKQARGYTNFKKEKEELLKIIEEQDNEEEMVSLATKELNELIKKQEEYEKILKIFNAKVMPSKVEMIFLKAALSKLEVNT